MHDIAPWNVIAAMRFPTKSPQQQMGCSTMKAELPFTCLKPTERHGMCDTLAFRVFGSRGQASQLRVWIAPYKTIVLQPHYTSPYDPAAHTSTALLIKSYVYNDFILAFLCRSHLIGGIRLVGVVGYHVSLTISCYAH